MIKMNLIATTCQVQCYVNIEAVRLGVARFGLSDRLICKTKAQMQGSLFHLAGFLQFLRKIASVSCPFQRRQLNDTYIYMHTM